MILYADDDPNMPIKPIADKEHLTAMIKALSPGIDKRGKNVLSEINLHWFRGIPSWVMTIENEPVTLYCAYFGKRRANVWSPYMNAYTVFTRADVRRRGYATHIAHHCKRLAVVAGCRRMKDLAGTRIGYQFHTANKDQFWAWTDNNALIIDTPLVDPSEFPPDTTPIAARKWTTRTRPLSYEEAEELIKDKKFAYDE